MAIPRFNAQVQQMSIPRMKDFQYEQNVSIYKTLKAAGERIDNTFLEMITGTQSNPEYEIAMRDFEAASSSGDKEAAAEAKERLRTTPSTKFNWWG